MVRGSDWNFICWSAGTEGRARRRQAAKAIETTPMTPENTNRPLGPIALITPAAIGGPTVAPRRVGQDQGRPMGLTRLALALEVESLVWATQSG